METTTTEDISMVVIVLGPVVVLALVGALIYWLRKPRDGNDRGQTH